MRPASRESYAAEPVGRGPTISSGRTQASNCSPVS